MKLAEHVEHIRQLIDIAFRNRLGRMGITSTGLKPLDIIPSEYLTDRKRIETIFDVLTAETGSVADAYEKLVEEFTFTFFNRIAALKVMEAHTLHSEIITRRSQHGDRSFAHKYWLEQNPNGRNEEMEGLVRFIEDQFVSLTEEIPLFSPKHPYHILPTVIELNGIITAFNLVETDGQVETNIWKNDDVLGWLYESYNNVKKEKHKSSGDKIEFNNVSLRSQIYTPRWVVKFLVDNSLGKMYLEMFPSSGIKNLYKIANAPKKQTRIPKPLTEIRLVDPATGSGNFLLYAFDLFYDLYTDQIENYGATYDGRKIAELIINHNLFGVDLDDRAIQIAQLGLYIKAKRKKRSAKIEHFNVVSSDFFLPEYKVVKHLFEDGEPLAPELEKIVIDLWTDLQQAYKFGALIRLEEKFSMSMHGLVQQFGQKQMHLFEEQTLANYDNFRYNFFANLQIAVTQNTDRQGQSFLNTKTQDAITFLQILTQKYDVAVANPPYTDSADFGSELKKFIEENYKQSYKFNSNLYAAFIKRCSELVNETGFVGMLHPLTFMYISSFKDVRKYILTKTHIEILAELGLGGVFANSDVQADVVAYTFNNSKNENPSLFLDFKKYKNHTNKPEIFYNVYENLINNIKDDHIFYISQNDFMDVEDWPFIYWISDRFREKFKAKAIDDVLNPRQGIATGNNDRCVRFWWEVNLEDISKELDDNKSWKFYSKGGPYNKWFGNFWTVINYSSSGYNYLLNNGNHLPSRNFYFKEGITYCASGSKGVSFRYMPSNHLFDVGGSCIFPGDYYNINYSLSLLNSKLVFYIANCLNPTVNTQVGDLKRIPFVKPTKSLETQISELAFQNIEIKKSLCSFRIIETNYKKNPLLTYKESSLKDRLLAYLDYENIGLTNVLLNEAVINKLIFQVYELIPEDQMQVESNMGKSVGDFPVLSTARKEFLNIDTINNKIVLEHINSLPEIQFDEKLIREIKDSFNSLYQGNSNLEEFCIKFQINPINVWYWFKQTKVLPESVAAEYSLEFLADSIRALLMADEDGIIPLVGLSGEPSLLNRLELHCLDNGFNSAQFMQLDNLLGRPINQYLEFHFFSLFSDHIKLFKQMPSTPFIWHISSGEYQGFEAYIIIYKWNRDSLYKLKSNYLNKRTESLQYRQHQISESTSAQAQSEKEKIRLQLHEIEIFSKKIDELIAGGYDPKLDSGVGKNIAPLQMKGMLRAEVLNKKQLEKYLNADW